MPPAILVKNLSKTYRRSVLPAVDNITFSIPEGMIYGLLGPNGAGKTTTISMLCGLIRPDAGEISILGMSYRDQKEKIKRSIGIVPQEIALYPALTAGENLQYIGNMYGLKGTSLKQKIDAHLEMAGLSEHRHKLISAFSGGMKRRINLVAGILHSPKILFLDEPTVGVDVQSRNMILSHLRELNSTGMTIIYTSHHMEEAAELCAEISVMDHGKIILSGDPKTLISNANATNLEDLFLKLTGRMLRDRY